MQFAKRQWSTSWVRHTGAALAIALLLGFLGPFGSQEAYERPSRYAFWLGLTLFGYICALAAFVLLEPPAPRPPRAAGANPPCRVDFLGAAVVGRGLDDVAAPAGPPLRPRRPARVVRCRARRPARPGAGRVRRSRRACPALSRASPHSSTNCLLIWPETWSRSRRRTIISRSTPSAART